MPHLDPGPDWMPIGGGVDRDGRPFIQWQNLSGADFSAAFFGQSLTDDVPVNTGTDAVYDRLRQGWGRQPSGLIFHLSRSGSSLVKHMLAAVSGVWVASEPPALSPVLGWRGAYLAPDLRHDLLAALVAVLGCPPSGPPAHYLLKPSSWQTGGLPLLLSAVAPCPKLFVIRQPVEVMVSLLEDPPLWAKDLAANPIKGGWLLGCAPHLVPTLEPEEFYARLLARIITTVLEHWGPDWLLVDYTQLPMAVPDLVLPFFGLAATPRHRAEMLARAAWYSKAKGDPRPFVPDSARKQTAATDRVLEAVERHLAEPYARLLAVRNGG